MEPINARKLQEAKKSVLFPNKLYSIADVEKVLMTASDDFVVTMSNYHFRSPAVTRMFAIFGGIAGADRFYLGNIASGFLKCFTFGGLGIWWLIDIFSAGKRCRTQNCKKLMNAANDPVALEKVKKTVKATADTIDFAKKAAPVVKAAVKGAKEIGDTFYVK